MLALKIKRIEDIINESLGDDPSKSAPILKLICGNNPYVNKYIDLIMSRKNKESIQQSLSGFQILIEMCMENGISPSELHMVRNNNNRPYIENMKNVDFNISHTDIYVAVALEISASPRVGLDIESAAKDLFSETARREKIAARFFSEREYKLLEVTGFDPVKFIEIWTKKEAYLKYTGEGISKMADFDSFSGETDNLKFITAHPSQESSKTIFTLCTASDAEEANIDCDI